jgi:hypothetical protein
MLSSTNVYFFESGLFNGLQPIQTKNFRLFILGLVQVVLTAFPNVPTAARATAAWLSNQIDIVQISDFCNAVVSKSSAVGWCKLPSRTVMAGLDLACPGHDAFKLSVHCASEFGAGLSPVPLDPRQFRVGDSRNRVGAGAGERNIITEVRYGGASASTDRAKTGRRVLADASFRHAHGEFHVVPEFVWARALFRKTTFASLAVSDALSVGNEFGRCHSRASGNLGIVSP